MKKQFLLPDPGEGLTEAEVVAWRVSVGDTVEVNDVLVEIETSKSLVELPSPFSGTVSALLVPEGTTVEVGSPIIEVDDGQDEAPAGAAPNLVGYGAADDAAGRRRRKVMRGRDPRLNQQITEAWTPHEPGRRSDEVHPVSAVTARSEGDPLPSPGEPPSSSELVLADESGDVLAKPTVRKYARELGVDLAGVVGTGIGGSITRRDVEAAAAFRDAESQPAEGRVVNDNATFQQRQWEHRDEPTQAPPRAPGSQPGRGERRVPIKGVRKATAENMVRSVNTHVHVTEWVTVDVTATMELVETLKTRREFAGLRVSPLLIHAKAVCLALGRNPDLNTSWDEAAQEIVYHGDVNLGIAAATPRGLMVPNIKGAQDLNLLQLCEAVNRLVAVSREGKLQPADYSGGTFTITNVGVFGVDSGTPVINGDESAIFCMGAIRRRPWVVGEGSDERVVPRWVSTLSVAFDHRIIDGEQGSRFLGDVAEILADPTMALLF